MGIGGGFLIERTRFLLGGKIGLKDFLDVLPMRSGSSTCMFGKPSRNRMRSTNLSACTISSIDFGAPLLRECLEAPVIQHAIVQPVLVDRGQFPTEGLD